MLTCLWSKLLKECSEPTTASYCATFLSLSFWFRGIRTSELTLQASFSFLFFFFLVLKVQLATAPLV